MVFQVAYILSGHAHEDSGEAVPKTLLPHTSGWPPSRLAIAASKTSPPHISFEGVTFDYIIRNCLLLSRNSAVSPASFKTTGKYPIVTCHLSTGHYLCLSHNFTTALMSYCKLLKRLHWEKYAQQRKTEKKKEIARKTTSTTVHVNFNRGLTSLS